MGGGTAPGRCLLPLTRTPKCVKWQTYVYVITVKGTILMFYVRDTKDLHLQLDLIRNEAFTVGGPRHGSEQEECASLQSVLAGTRQ